MEPGFVAGTARLPALENTGAGPLVHVPATSPPTDVVHADRKG